MKAIARDILRGLRAKFKFVNDVFSVDCLLIKDLAAQRVFKKSPFVLLDVGCSGGISHQWDLFGEDFSGFGFDPLVNECTRLNEIKKHPQFKYIPTFVGSGIPEIEAEEVDYNWFERSSAARAQTNFVQQQFNHGQELVYSKENTTLDQFCSKHHVDRVDFVKIDTDGYDYKVLRGGENLFSAPSTLGALVECNYSGSPGACTNCFRNIEGFLAEKGYRVFDMEVNRYTKHALPGIFSFNLDAQTQTGQACWGDVLFLRDFVEMKEKGMKVAPLSLLKMVSLLEMFNLPDCAAELIITFEDELAPLINIKKSLDLLAQDMGLYKDYQTHITTFKSDPKMFYPE